MIGSAIEDRFIDQIYDGCLLAKCDTEWSDIGGLEEVKKSLKEVVIDPLRRPDIFTGLRAAPKARCIASQCQSSFFNVSASKLTSKWVGDGEKNVQALFAVARSFLSSFGFSNRTMQPSVIFIDEVDSVLSKRTEKENDASKKMKTEFLVQMARLQILKAIFIRERTSITEEDFEYLAGVLEGYSGADIKNVCKEASMLPVRECGDLDSIGVHEIRPTAKDDVLKAAKKMKPTVSPKDLVHNREFDKLFGDKP
ncbi:Fidgetin-like protein 1 [Frankliniella fusca]|uniref:Fidgetin-like protein 1 n=1 Tax=Frankliniella fusca TaxID=407009 RepID=A0AAE1HCH6_9NEOP|nr:Fidgetin-like protein 1 [Frankliniella fusca]